MTLYDEFDQFQCLACAEGEFLWWDTKVDADEDEDEDGDDDDEDDDDQLTVVVSFLHLSVPPKMLKELVLA